MFNKARNTKRQIERKTVMYYSCQTCTHTAPTDTMIFKSKATTLISTIYFYTKSRSNIERVESKFKKKHYSRFLASARDTTLPYFKYGRFMISHYGLKTLGPPTNSCTASTPAQRLTEHWINVFHKRAGHPEEE